MAIAVNGRVRVKDRADRVSGTVIRLVSTVAGDQADVSFEHGGVAVKVTLIGLQVMANVEHTR